MPFFGGKASLAPSSSAKPATKKAKTLSSKAKSSDASPPNSPRVNPLTAFANTQAPASTAKKASQPSRTSKSKGKGKGKEKERHASSIFDAEDDRLWVDIYEPVMEAELAVHVRKVQDVQRWLDEAFVGGPSGKLRKYRWRNAMEVGSSRFGDDGQNDTYSSDHESLFSKFEAFLTRASTCQTIFADASDRGAKLSPDPPNILHAATQQRFHAALQSLIGAPHVDPVPVVVIVSDAGTRGEAWDERLASGVWGGGARAMGCLIGSAPTKEMLDIVVETSNGDIRSAIMALQFSCVPTLGGSSVKAARKKGGGAGGGAKLVLEAVTRREQSLTLFHLMGRVLYNKWKGDPPNSSATAKDIQRDQVLDTTLKDPPKLPKFLAAKSAGRVGTKKLSHEEGSGVLHVHGLGTGTRCGAVYATCAPSASVKRGIAPSPPLVFPALVHRPLILLVSPTIASPQCTHAPEWSAPRGCVCRMRVPRAMLVPISLVSFLTLHLRCYPSRSPPSCSTSAHRRIRARYQVDTKLAGDAATRSACRRVPRSSHPFPLIPAAPVRACVSSPSAQRCRFC
ncbi:hypothetical protein B0H16DRAFT_1747969 [Mycena metata]|uniref:Uncharacterized protein n=1 Tax=Mycena metata TaxID=1033252 RepID=A0AAD7E1Z0_9AGAR|nr:hypothetical protein B0H16DRAFT_1747969 [Mycena metata]